MDSLRQYILTVIAAAIICSVISPLTSKKTTVHTVLKLVCGIFLVITIIKPFQPYSKFDFSDIYNALEVTADEYVQDGVLYASAQKETFIIENVQSYILDRAKELDVNIDVTVELDPDTTMPNIVYLSGNVSPLKKSRLQQIITDALGIPEEQQIWQ